MNFVVPDQRIVKGISSTLRWSNVDENGATVAAAATPTVTVVNSAGATVLASGSASVDPDVIGGYVRTLPAQASQELLTATWSVSGVPVDTTLIEVTGGFYFSIVEMRAAHPALADDTKVTLADLIRIRNEVECECEEICDRAFVPRFARLTLSGNGGRELVVSRNDLIALSSVTLDGTTVPLSATDPFMHDDQVVERIIGANWSTGRRNVNIAFTFGLNAPPPDLKRAALIRAREVSNMPGKGIPGRTKTYSEGGSTFTLNDPDAYRTGNPDIDPVYQRYSRRKLDNESDAPVSRPLVFMPQFDSMFHGRLYQ